MSRAEEFVNGTPADELSEHDRRIIDFAGRSYQFPGKRAEDMRVELGYSETQFAQHLSRLLSDPKAMEYNPAVIKRHQRIVDHGLTKWGREPRYS